MIANDFFNGFQMIIVCCCSVLLELLNCLNEQANKRKNMKAFRFSLSIYSEIHNQHGQQM